MSGFYPCFAKEAVDHRAARGFWKCSYCGVEAPWSDGWSYFGMLECKKCGGQHIDEVRCEECSKKDGIAKEATP